MTRFAHTCARRLRIWSEGCLHLIFANDESVQRESGQGGAGSTAINDYGLASASGVGNMIRGREVHNVSKWLDEGSHHDRRRDDGSVQT